MIDDTLYQLVYEVSGGGENAGHASTVGAVRAPKKFARGMMSGVEVAQRSEATSGVSTGFLVAQAGPCGAVA